MVDAVKERGAGRNGVHDVCAPGIDTPEDENQDNESGENTGPAGPFWLIMGAGRFHEGGEAFFVAG